ncbi:hypothetical protein [Cytobacillus oceanisediminis]|nr:hypothetical protein [Cytobacillus oceanisediminis]
MGKKGAGFVKVVFEVRVGVVIGEVVVDDLKKFFGSRGMVVRMGG